MSFSLDLVTFALVSPPKKTNHLLMFLCLLPVLHPIPILDQISSRMLPHGTFCKTNKDIISQEVSFTIRRGRMWNPDSSQSVFTENTPLIRQANPHTAQDYTPTLPSHSPCPTEILVKQNMRPAAVSPRTTCTHAELYLTFSDICTQAEMQTEYTGAPMVAHTHTALVSVSPRHAPLKRKKQAHTI